MTDIVTKLFQFQHQNVSPKMYRDSTPKCKVCEAYCSQQDWDRSRSCTSCYNFYQRSTEKMNRYLLKTKTIEKLSYSLAYVSVAFGVI